MQQAPPTMTVGGLKVVAVLPRCLYTAVPAFLAHVAMAEQCNFCRGGKAAANPDFLNCVEARPRLLFPAGCIAFCARRVHRKIPPNL